MFAFIAKLLGVDEATSHQRARAIMGKNFLGLKQVERLYDVKYSKEECEKLASIPFNDGVLKACADNTHVLMPGFPMSINDIRKHRKVRGSSAKLFADLICKAMYDYEVFAKTPVEVRWFLFRKKPIDGSGSLNYKEQLQLIPPGEKNPRVADAVYAIVSTFLITKECLFDGVDIRCSDVDSHGLRVRVGSGLFIDSYWGDGSDERCFICSIREES